MSDELLDMLDEVRKLDDNAKDSTLFVFAVGVCGVLEMKGEINRDLAMKLLKAAMPSSPEPRRG